MVEKSNICNINGQDKLIKNITPVIISKNSELHIEKCLKSLEIFQEVVVYDNGSTDKTLEICKQFPNVKIFIGKFYGFGPTKNHAANLAKTDWVFSIDSDEVATDELIHEIKMVDLSDKTKVFKVNRKNLFLGTAIKHSGWNPDWIARIYNKKHTSFTTQKIHEKIVIHKNTKVESLKGRLIHYAVNDLNDFLIKAAQYSSIKRENQKCHSSTVILFRALFAFFRTFLLKKGFLDGHRGLIISVGQFIGVFFKYMKQYEKCK